MENGVQAPVEILVPGRGLVNVAAMRADEAAREYDERLNFGFNPTNGDWCVFIKLPRDYEYAPYFIEGNPVAIVLGFGRDNIPSPERIKQRLWETDSYRHGDQLLKNLNEANEKLKKEQAEKVDEQIQEAAERAEHALRHMGESPVTKVFFQKVGRRRGYRVGKRNDAGD